MGERHVTRCYTPSHLYIFGIAIFAGKFLPNLCQGLHLLEYTDLRNLFNDTKVPLLLIGGERDTLVPKSALVELSKSTNVTTSIIEKAGHAPFLSHPEQCIEEIRRFCHVQ